MTTDYNEIVIPLVVSKVMKFLGFKESMKGIGSVNKTHRQILIEGTIIMNKTREGRLDELSGSILSCILNAGRLYPFVGQLVDDNPKEFSVKATSHLMKTYDTRGLKGLGFRIEEARLNASMYTYWKRTPQSKTDGSLNYIRENVTKLHSISQDQVETAVDRDVKYWRESRVFDTFGVLLERSDGTIVISQDLRRVYLVLGISTSLGSVFQQQSKLPFRYDSNRTQLASSLCKRLLFASATMTLVPWEGGIVFDGIAVGSKDMPNPYVCKRQMEAYWRAVDNGTVITSLRLLTEDEAGAVPTLEAIEQCKLTRSHKLHYLKSTSPVQDVTWIFRQCGSTEEENPGHRMNVIELHSYSLYNLVTVAQTAGIVPTLEEYVDIIFDAVKERNGRSVCRIKIDVESLVESLEAVLADARVRVYWHAPISKEDVFLNDLTGEYSTVLSKRLAKLDLKLCALCTAPQTDEGNPLLRCSSCKRACYCCKEHQKIDWPNHRDLCKNAKLEE